MICQVVTGNPILRVCVCICVQRSWVGEVARFRPSSLLPLASSAPVACPNSGEMSGILPSGRVGEELAHLALNLEIKVAHSSLIAAPSQQPLTAWAASFCCGTSAGGTSQTDGSQIASSLRPGSFQPAWQTPQGPPGKTDGQERRVGDGFIDLQPGCQWWEVAWQTHAWAACSLKVLWRSTRDVRPGSEDWPGSLEGTHSRPEEGGKVRSELWTLIHQPAAH